MGLLGTRSILVASTPILSVLGLRIVLTYLVCICEIFFLPSAPRSIYFEGVYIACAVFYSAGHKVLCRNLSPTQLLCGYVYVTSIELFAASYLFRINIHLPVPSLSRCGNDPTQNAQTV